MAIQDITNPEWVRMAMGHYRELGEESFLERYGFAASKKFDVLDDHGRRYPPKAILAVAHGYRSARSRPLTSHDFSGGQSTNKPLRRLGFAVVEKEPTARSLLPSIVGNDVQFDPTDITDARERVAREIVQRRGQQRFRNQLLAAYKSRCAISKCEVLHVLEAAHIFPYLGKKTNDVTNGILLRADLHTLYDLKLIGINPNSLKIYIAPVLKESGYVRFSGMKIALPDDPNTRPSTKALELRWEEFSV